MPAKLDRCVDDVEGQKGVGNAYAICQSAINKKKETHLQEKQKFPYPFPAINSKDATEEAVAIGGGLSAQSVGGKTIKPDKEFDKLHEALMQEGGQGSGRKPNGYTKTSSEGLPTYSGRKELDKKNLKKKEFGEKYEEAHNLFGSQDLDVSAKARNPEDVHPFGEGRDPTKTLDPEPSPVGHRDPSQTLDPSTEKYDYGSYDEGGPGSGPRKGGGKQEPGEGRQVEPGLPSGGRTGHDAYKDEPSADPQNDMLAGGLMKADEPGMTPEGLAQDMAEYPYFNQASNEDFQNMANGFVAHAQEFPDEGPASMMVAQALQIVADKGQAQTRGGFAQTEEGGPGSGPQGGFSNPNASSVGTPAKNIGPQREPTKSQGQPTVVKKRFSLDPLPQVVGQSLKAYPKAVGLTEIEETICPCSEFDKVHEALKHESKS